MHVGVGQTGSIFQPTSARRVRFKLTSKGEIAVLPRKEYEALELDAGGIPEPAQGTRRGGQHSTAVVKAGPVQSTS
jgi:hypothetical protein